MTAGIPDRTSGPESPLAPWLARYEAVVPPVSTAGAAVTIVLRSGRRGPEVLLIERASNPDDLASGQVALPGGRVADGDGSLTATALRELEEEVGLAELDLDGPLRFVRTHVAQRFGLRVGVFVAPLAARASRPTPRSELEVAHVFWLPSDELGRTRTVEVVEPRGALRVPATVFKQHVLWGFTRRVLREFFGLPEEGEWEGPAFPSHPSFEPPSEEEPGPAPGSEGT
jgi:8-oxo-dGTP pyrophosphatase MutT (NUDIX family)